MTSLQLIKARQMAYISNTGQDKKEMLKTLSLDSVDGLFKDIPEKLLLKEQLRLPKSLPEIGLKRHMQGLASKNKAGSLNFLGAGSYNHFIPSVVSHITSRSEFYTAYTPYQPEISQGILQAMYEYQTMICDLTGLDVSNASMYDGASALAESALMACNITKRKKVLVSKAIHPEYREVVKTYCHFHDILLKELDYDDGITSMADAEGSADSDTAAIIVQSPNFFGCIESFEEAARIAHSKGSLLIVCVIETTSLGILRSPGSYNVDIVCGEGQSFGNPMSFGGPYLGIIAAKQSYLRHMPGRLVGKTVDSKGSPGFILTLQAREQHIRREKAASNICSNEALNALAACVYLSALGKSGVKKIGELCLHKAHYLKEKIAESGFKAEFTSPFYNEFVVRFSKNIHKALLENNILTLDLEKYYPDMKNCILFCATELNTKEEMDKLVKTIGDANANNKI